MLNKEQDILLRLLSNRDVEGEFDWLQVYELSKEQAVAGVSFDAVQNIFKHSRSTATLVAPSIPTKVTLQWYALQQQIEQQNRKVNKVLYKVVDALERNNIKAVLLKGQGLAQLYDNPLHRNPGDIDLYVGSDNYEAAKQVLRNRGWLDDSVHEDLKHLTFSVDEISIELHYYAAIVPGFSNNSHFQLMIRHSMNNLMVGFFVEANGEAGIESGAFVWTLPNEVNAIYTFIHLFGHFVMGGISLKQLTDWAMLVGRLSKNDYNFESTLKNVGFYKPWQVFGCVLAKYYGIKQERIPCYNAKYETKAELVMERIMADGKQHNVSTHMNGFVAKIGFLFRMVTNFARMARLFPMRYIAYCIQQIMNTSRKYLNLMRGRVH